MDLFDHAQSESPKAGSAAPLADRMRPRSIDELIGQEHLLGPKKALRIAMEQERLPSMILWGPPGSGKTTLAMLLASAGGANFQPYSAVTSGIKELKEAIVRAQGLLKYEHRRTILFIDEIHRFNKAQQDAFLPHVERGTVILIGATTENPSFEVNAALLSRCRVMVLKSLEEKALVSILQRALADPERGLGKTGLKAEPEALLHLARSAHGDARAALNALELAAQLVNPAGPSAITLGLAEEALQHKALRYDKDGEEHYNLISALHKSVRGSDPDAALYWLARMLEAGEDPKFLLRRLARMASEDIGLADPRALDLASSAIALFNFIGLPEGKLALAELAVYLALAPKSNALHLGYQAAQEEVKKSGELEVPLRLRNAPTQLMRSLEYGKEYKYAHDYEGHWVAEDYLPDFIRSRRFYKPGGLGWEGKQIPELEIRWKKREAARTAAPPRSKPQE